MSDETPYSRFWKTDLILRDELAIDRTNLANERTLLSYLRSAVALLIAGVSIIHFAQGGWFFVVGAVCIPGGLMTASVGILRFRKMRHSIAAARKRQPTLTS